MLWFELILMEKVLQIRGNFLGNLEGAFFRGDLVILFEGAFWWMRLHYVGLKKNMKTLGVLDGYEGVC